MELSEYKVGDKVDIYVYGKKRPATVTMVSDEGVEVKLDNSMLLKGIDGSDFIAHLEPTTYIDIFLIKYAGIIDKIKE